MFERFSTLNQRVAFFARAEASVMGSRVLDTEHLLLGLLRLDSATFRRIAEPPSIDAARETATRWTVPGEQGPRSSDMPITEDVKEAFANAAFVASEHKSSQIRTEHLLLALMKMPDSHAAVLLAEMLASQVRLEELVASLPPHDGQNDMDLSPDDLAFMRGT
jgi:ATP-dependent Clp protease ATP-binding subunit ClpA